MDLVYNESLIELGSHMKKRMIVGRIFSLKKIILSELHGIHFLHAEIHYLLHALKFEKRSRSRDFSNLHKEEKIMKEYMN